MVNIPDNHAAPVPTALPDAALPTARQLLLNLLLVADGGRMDAASAVRACALFDISANNARVALNRLVASGLADAVGRGAYQLGDAGRVLGDDVGAWRQAEHAVHPWDGGWVVAMTAGLGRVDRQALRQRERALALLGMRALDAELHVRPANLVGGVAQVRSRLLTLGLEPAAAVFAARDFDAEREARARALWDVKALVRTYRQGQQALTKSMARLERLPLERATREAYLAGNQAIRQLVFDPLLPEPLIAVSERRAFRNAVLRYDAVGRAIWQRFLSSAA